MKDGGSGRDVGVDALNKASRGRVMEARRSEGHANEGRYTNETIT
jgi:hypothetical protein